MKVLELKNDLDFQGLLSEEHERLIPLVDKLDKPIGEFEFPEFYVCTPKNRIGNFYNMVKDLLVFDDVALNALSYEVGVAGESYKINVDDVGTLNALNVTETCDALDHNKAVWRDETDGRKIVLLQYAFCAEKIITGSGLFKIAENRFSRIFAVTGMRDQQGDFYARYKEAGLTGLKFTEMWSDEND